MVGSESERHAVPPLAYDVMRRLLPGLKEAARGGAKWLRRKVAPDEAWTIPPWEVGDVPTVQEFLQSHARRLVEREGWSRDDAINDANLLGTHLFVYVNYELHRRRTFWVDESLAWMLARTDLDIRGDVLRLPFPSCAFAFTDSRTLDVAASFLRNRSRAIVRDQPLSALTVHLTQIPADPPARGLNATLLFGAGPEHWPYLVSRDIPIRPDADLDAILRGHFADAQEEDDFFEAPELLQVFELIVNAVLFATSTIDPIVLVSPVGRRAPPGEPVRGSAAQAAIFSSQDVFHLPGKIEISALRRMTESTTGTRGELTTRTMVRGHWRRANPSWKDQRLRWIEPYWKGPEEAVAVEREYRLKP